MKLRKAARSLTPWILIASLCLMILAMTAFTTPAQAVHPASAASVQTSPQPAREIRPLVPAQPIEGEIAGGQSHSYFVAANEGQYIRVSLEQTGINLMARFLDESGRPVSETTRPHGPKEPKNVFLLTTIAGNYRLEIAQNEPKARLGKYIVRIEEMREATAQDRSLVAGEIALREGERLTGQGGVGSAFRQAIEKYLEADKHFEAAGASRRRVLTLRYLGLHYSILGEKEKGLTMLQQSVPITQKIGDQVGEINALNGIGSILHDLDEKQKALHYLEQALRVAQTLGDSRLEGMTLGNLGRTYRALRNNEKALELFTRSLQLRTAAKDQAGQAIVIVHIGELLSKMGQNQKAIEMFNQALSLARSIGHHHVEGSALGQLGMAYHELGENQKALQYLEQTLLHGKKIEDPSLEATANYQIGHIQYEQGAIDKAVESLHLALPIWKQTGIKNSEASTHFYLARCEKDRGSLTAARTHIETAITIAEELRGKIESKELRAHYFSSVQDFYEFHQQLLVAMHQAQPDPQRLSHQKFLSAALESSERARARSLLDLLSESRVDIRQGISSELKAREKSNAIRLSAIQTQLLQLRRQAKPDQKQIDVWMADLKKADDEREQIEREIRQQSPRYAALRYPTPLKADEIRALLDDQTALLEYSIGEKYSLLFVVTPETVSAFPLPEAKEIRAQIEELRVALRQPGRREFIGYTKNAQQLYQMLIAPAEKLLTTKKRLLIVPDKQLYYVPFESLLTRSANDSAEVSARQLPYLLRQWAVSYVPSASVLASMRQNRPVEKNSGAKEFLAFADPLYQTNPLADRKAPVEKIMQVAMRGSLENEGRLELPRLTESQRETVQIAKLFGVGQSKLFLGENAREENVKNSAELATARRLHFATHGLISERQPQLSSLVLTLDNDPGEDGLLQMREIFNLKLQADLVVLSACETGLGREMKGEGVIGLTRAFFYAGAASVVVSLWQVADRSTADLMIDFYREMESGADKAEALRRAKLRMIENGRYAHPYYWASFALNGETR